MTTRVASLEAIIGANLDPLRSGLSQAEGLLTGFGGRAVGATSGIGSGIATSMAVGVRAVQGGARTIGAVLNSMPAQMVGAAVQMAVEWESAFAGVRKTVEGTVEELATLEGQLRDMATGDTPVAGLENAHTELARIAELAGQLGVPTGQIADFTETIAMLGMATDMIPEDAAVRIAQFANITGMDLSDVERLGSVIVDLGNNMATTESTIMEFGSRLAGAASNAGFAEKEILAIAAALGSVGLAPEAGATSMNRLIMEMGSAAAIAGPKLQVFADVAGTTGDAFADMFEEDPAQALTDFVAGFGELGIAEQATVLNDLGLSGTRVADMMARISAKASLLPDAFALADTAWDEGTALMGEATTRFATSEAQMNKFNNRMNDLGITVGSTLMPTFNDLLNVGGGVVEMLGGLIAQDPQVFADGWNSVVEGIESLTGLELPDFSTMLESWATAGERLGMIFMLIGERLTTGIQQAGIEIEMLLQNLMFAALQVAMVAQGGVTEEQTAGFQTNIGMLEARQGVLSNAQELALELRAAMEAGDFSNIELTNFSYTLPEVVDGELTGNVTENITNLLEMAASGVEINPDLIAPSMQSAILDGLAMASDIGDAGAVELLLPLAYQLDTGAATGALAAAIGDATRNVDMAALDILVPLAMEYDLQVPDMGEMAAQATGIAEMQAMGQLWTDTGGAEDSAYTLSFAVTPEFDFEVVDMEAAVDIEGALGDLDLSASVAVDIALDAGFVDTSAVQASLRAALDEAMDIALGGGSGGGGEAVAGGMGYGGAAGGMPHFQSGGMMPYDGLAFLHAGERVLNPGETRDYEGGGRAPVIINLQAYGSNPHELMRMVQRAAEDAGM